MDLSKLIGASWKHSHKPCGRPAAPRARHRCGLRRSLARLMRQRGVVNCHPAPSRGAPEPLPASNCQARHCYCERRLNGTVFRPGELGVGP